MKKILRNIKKKHISVIFLLIVFIYLLLIRFTEATVLWEKIAFYSTAYFLDIREIKPQNIKERIKWIETAQFRGILYMELFCSDLLNCDWPGNTKGNIAWEWYEKGEESYWDNKPEEAIKYFEIAVEIDPYCIKAWHRMAYLLYEQEKYEEEIAWCDKSLECCPYESFYIEESKEKALEALKKNGF